MKGDLKAQEMLTQIAVDTAAIRASVERMEGQAAPVMPSAIAWSRLKRFRITQDIELRTYVTDALRKGEAPLKHVYEAAVEQFGKERVGGYSSMHRFAVALDDEMRMAEEL